MKARIYIYTIVLAAGLIMVLAQETKTNTPTSVTTSTPNASEAAVLPPMTATSAPAPVVAKEGRPPAVAPLKPTKVVAPVPMTATSAPAPAIANEVKPPDVVLLEETNAVPAQTEVTAESLTPTNAAASTPESSGIGRKGVWAGGAAFLVMVGGLAIFMWRRSHAASQGSLISSAMNEDQKTREDKNVPPPMA
jgi:hypothetical protein